MKALLRFYSPTLLKYRSCYIKFTLILLVAAMFCAQAVAQANTIKWVGDGAGGTLLQTDFNTPSNWNPAQVPTATDSVVLLITDKNKVSNINFSGSVTIKSLTILIPSGGNFNNEQVYFNVGSNTLTVLNTTWIDVLDDHPLNAIYIGVNNLSSAGVIDFKGDVTFGNTLLPLNKGVYINGNSSSTIISRGNFTLGKKGRVASNPSAPGTLLFDGTVTQNFIFNNTDSAKFNKIIVGSGTASNSKVVVGSTNTPANVPDNILGDITVNGSSTLDLSSSQLNRYANGGNLSLKNTSTLRLAGLSSVLNGALPTWLTLIPGSNFPSGFTNIVLDSTSTVEFYGTLQSIPGASHNITGYGNLTLTGSTKTLISSFAMYRNLSIAASTTMVFGAFDDTLKSNAITTAYVSLVPTTAVISYTGTGRFVIERYITAYKSWRLLAAPIDTNETTTISQAWRENNGPLSSTGYGTQITGPQVSATPNAAGVLDVYTQRGSMKSYVPSLNNYVEVSNANTTKIANTAGYYIFVRGDRGVGLTGTTGSTNLRMKGKIRTGDQTFTVPTNKFASVGNPFPSRVDFRTIYNSTISPSYYVWNPNPAGTYYNAGKYEVYVNYGDGNYRLGNATGPIHNYIESGQAVFIQSVTGGTITVKESDKFGGSSLVSRGNTTGRQGVTTPTIDITLFTKDANNQEVVADAVALNFAADNSNGVDNMDVRKLLNASDNLSLNHGAVNLVVDRRAGLTAADTIFLNLSNTRIGSYHFNIDPSVLNYPTLKAFLVDKFLNTEVAVSLTAATDYAFTTTADVASRATDRFIITFKAVTPAVFTAIKTVRNENNSVAVTWNMATENNINNYEIERSIDGINFTAINTQLPTANNMGNPYYTYTDDAAPKSIVWYRIKSNLITGTTIQYSAIAAAKAVEINTKNGISIYPNPVVDGNINLYFNNKAGTYTISIADNSGKVVRTSTAIVKNNANLNKIAITNAAAGIYNATVTDEKGNTVSIPFVKL